MRTVSVVIPNFNGRRLLPSCLDAIHAQTVPPDEVIVVDNGSADDSVAYLRDAHPDVRVLGLPRNLGFAGGVNRGVLAAAGDRIAVLNSDARPRADWLEQLLAAPAPPDVWQWGSILISPTTGLVESAGDLFNDEGFAYKHARETDPALLPSQPYYAFAGPGAAPLIRRDVFAELGGYEERFFLYYEDIDLAYRALLRGYRALVVPAARVEHDMGATSVRRRTRFYVARNSLWTTARCVPDLPERAVARRVLNELRWNRPRRLLYAEVAGRIAGLAGLPRVLRERRRIQADRRITPAQARGRLGVDTHMLPPCS